MLISSSGTLMDELRQHPLLNAEQQEQLPQLAQGRCGSARLFAKTLIQKGWLSVYQVNQFLAGKGDELVIGPYQVLDRLGQGGLSAVYKARHGEHQNLVALKMIKAEVFASAEGRRQFLLEVEAMARLDHPNIVQFCDADQWRDTFYFAMEYVDGTDLGKVVRLSGALPVQEACDYIRQAALGLQHAYERNLIHRDIKPVNLFLTHVSAEPPIFAQLFATSKGEVAPPGAKATMLMKPLIKILDWGLASMQAPKNASGTAASESVERSILGTADYFAPEQACNANAADARSDVYSLGCSLYFLLTGQAPYPDGTVMQKILLHQQGEPRPIEEFRGDVPHAVVAILKRMMAKKPEDRFQTPASAAAALAAHTRRPGAGSSVMLPTLRKPLPNRDDTPLPSSLADDLT